MARILVLAGVNGAGKSSLLGSLLQEQGATWYNPDAFTRALVQRGWPPGEANAQAWQEGVRRLQHALSTNTDFAFETTLGAHTIPQLLRAASAQHQVTIWYCGLQTVALHLQRVAARVAAGGHDIPAARIRQRFDSSRANLVALLPHLTALHVYDNSAPPHEDGQVEPQLLLEMSRTGLHYPSSLQELQATPDWAKPILMAALHLHQPA